MLDNMRHFQKVALDAEAVLDGLTVDEVERHGRHARTTVQGAVGEGQENRRLRDAAAFMHPKLAAIEHTGANGGPIEIRAAKSNVMPQSAQRSEPILTPEDYAFSRLIAYAAYQWPGYRDAPHHRLIASKLEAVERGEITRLMITMPPRHGKSMLASEFFPAWYLGRNPDHYVVTATYAQDLADDFGRKVKNQIEDPAVRGDLPRRWARRTTARASSAFTSTQPLEGGFRAYAKAARRFTRLVLAAR
jgi:hypothetical protein